jgi:hypothetical protein
VALVIVVCVRWALQSRGDRVGYVAAGLALAGLVPAGFMASGVADALRDRIDARACAFTHVASGVRGSPWGLGLYDVDIGQRAFSSRRGDLGQAIDAVQRGVAYTAYYACHSASLASLEPASARWKLAELTEHLLELGQLFGFDAADLDANRAGEVNIGQLPFWRLAGTLFFAGLFAAGGIACWLALREQRTLSMLGILLARTAQATTDGHAVVERDEHSCVRESRSRPRRAPSPPVAENWSWNAAGAPTQVASVSARLARGPGEDRALAPSSGMISRPRAINPHGLRRSHPGGQQARARMEVMRGFARV